MTNDFVFVSTIQTCLTFKENQTFLISTRPNDHDPAVKMLHKILISQEMALLASIAILNVQQTRKKFLEKLILRVSPEVWL